MNSENNNTNLIYVFLTLNYIANKKREHPIIL